MSQSQFRFDRYYLAAVLASAWTATTTVAILAAARAGASVGDAVLAPLLVATGAGLLVYGPGRWSLRGVAVALVFAGLVRGYALLADLVVVPPVAAATNIADAAVLVGVVLATYDVWVVRRSARQQ